MKNLTWQNPEQLFVAQELINKVKSKCCGIKGDEELAVEKVTLTTTGKAIEFAVSGSVVDGEDGVVNEPMQWVVTVYKNGKEIEKKSLSFRDGKEIGMDDLNLYYN